MRTPAGAWLALALIVLAPQDARGWGFLVHRLVNRAAVSHLPVGFDAFGQWADSLEALAVEADRRRCCDPEEEFRHYIDIDDYEEFFTGTLPHTYAEMVARFGRDRVHGNGLAPWAIETALARLTEHFRERDWARAVAVAADIGHYVADTHQPLHLTSNYDGQLTGQRGVHSRYESALLELHQLELVPAPGHVSGYVRPLDVVFEWIEVVYPGGNVVLNADWRAQRVAGDTEGPVYYDILWRETGAQTQRCIRAASLAVAGMWLTAWFDAGAPSIPGGSGAAPFAATLRLLPNEPNPFNPRTTLRFELPEPGPATLRILDVRGRVVRRLLDGDPGRGERSLSWDGCDDAGRGVASGAYRVRLEQRGRATERSAVLVR
jgi:hypothetical protein